MNLEKDKEPGYVVIPEGYTRLTSRELMRDGDYILSTWKDGTEIFLEWQKIKLYPGERLTVKKATVIRNRQKKNG